MRTPQNAQRSTFQSSASPRLRVKNLHSRRGATLLVTLGIMTVLSVLVVTFLVTARLQRQVASSQHARFAARNHIAEGLHLAMKMVEESFTYPNFTGEQIPDSAYLTHQRLAPVGHWFTQEYAEANDISDDILFQGIDVLASPAASNGPTVNLLSPKALSLVPAALTNGLQLSSKKMPVFRSGWSPVNLMMGDALDFQLHSPPARIAFVVFNCSGFIDANYFVGGPSTQKLPQVCFSQADVTNWLPQAQAAYSERFGPLKEVLNNLTDPNESPFFHLSYDPGPDIYPLHYDCFETCTTLGTFAFGSGPTIDLNKPMIGQILDQLRSLTQGNVQNKINFLKFNINSATNHFARGTLSTDTATPWFNDARFKSEWFDPAVYLLNMMRNEEPAATSHRWADSSAIAWTMANFMDVDRIPQVSDFPAAGATETVLSTRANYAVEDVPLINKISVFNIFDDDESIEAPKEPAYYDLNGSALSNHYAVAVELWYPFAPNKPPLDSACYVGIYTNAEDVITTTNQPWSQNEMRDWFDWNSADSSNSVMQTLFDSWVRAYTNQVGSAIWNHPLWQTVTDQGDLWFTPSMTNHPAWPVADSNGVFSITDTPIWQAFYPDTYEVLTTNQVEQVATNDVGVVSTNLVDVVSTNVYTYATVTNTAIEWVSEPDMTTNRFVGRIGTADPDPYPVLLWSNLTTSAFTTNVLGAVLDTNDTLVVFFTPAVDPNPAATNYLEHLFGTPEGLVAVVSNGTSGAVSTNSNATLVTSPWDESGEWLFSAQTNLFVTTEILPVEPLPMPEELGEALAELFALLPTNSVTDLYDFLLLRPDQFDDEDWGNLFDYFSENPAIMNNLLPSNEEPTLGFMTEKDRHALWPKDSEDDTVIPDPNVIEKLAANTFQGYFWTVYPKQTVCFKEVIEEKSENGVVTQPATTNYHALGASLNKKINTIWVRPAVTIKPGTETSDTPVVPADDEADPTLSDVIVDEALLTYKSDNPVPVWGWTSVTNLCIPDPRRNAYAKDWRRFPNGEQWLDPQILNTTNLNTGVSELPFIHFNTPFSTIGDIGHIYASYEPHTTAEEEGALPPDQRRNYDTLTFATRSGAALLDLFTLHPANAPTRGLVQANTQQRPVIKALFSDVTVGWTNSLATDGLKPLREIDSDQLKNWTDSYADALTNAPFSMGWRSYADMLPNISTNVVLAKSGLWNGLHPMHDYTEDALRGIVDKVSFRQNIFVIIVAAQSLSPASTPSRPVVLADQRAAVTVIRDAYTGRWTIRSWSWLTE